MSKFGALLLAGGASLRMGRPKSMLDYGGTLLWRRQVETLLSLEPDELYISGSPSLEFPAGPWKVLYDQRPGLGPLAGLEAALRVANRGADRGPGGRPAQHDFRVPPVAFGSNQARVVVSSPNWMPFTKELLPSTPG